MSPARMRMSPFTSRGCSVSIASYLRTLDASLMHTVFSYDSSFLLAKVIIKFRIILILGIKSTNKQVFGSKLGLYLKSISSYPLTVIFWFDNRISLLLQQKSNNYKDLDMEFK